MKKNRILILSLLLIITAVACTFYKADIINYIGAINHNLHTNAVSPPGSKLANDPIVHPSPSPSPASSPVVSLKPEKTPVPSIKSQKEVQGLVAVQDLDESFVVDLKYATTDNFTGKVIYPLKVCVLQKNTAQKLVKANEDFKKAGCRIKIWDSYRPVYVQQIFWDIVKDSRFVANPANGGSIHNRGTAVDLTLVDDQGRELKMPSKFDDFSTNAYRDNPKMDSEAKKNMDYLTDIMKKNGFRTIDTEWWHFEDNDSSKYKIVDVKLEEFISSP